MLGLFCVWSGGSQLCRVEDCLKYSAAEHLILCLMSIHWSAGLQQSGLGWSQLWVLPCESPGQLGQGKRSGCGGDSHWRWLACGRLQSAEMDLLPASLCAFPVNSHSHLYAWAAALEMPKCRLSSAFLLRVMCPLELWCPAHVRHSMCNTGQACHWIIAYVLLPF